LLLVELKTHKTQRTREERRTRKQETMSAVAVQKNETKKRSRFFPKKDATDEVDGPQVEGEEAAVAAASTEEVEAPPKKIQKVEDIGGVEVR
jgi:hypothetical protein